MIYDLQSEEFNFLSCMHVYEISIPSFSNKAIFVFFLDLQGKEKFICQV